MRFGVLGPVAVWAGDGTPVRVPEAKVRAVLAALLANDGRPVSADRLIDDLWGSTPPGNPANTLQTKVSGLRRALETAEPGARALVALRPGGYVLDSGETDAAQFTTLLARAREAADPHVKAGLLADALALWRGDAYADFRDESFARPDAIRLEEQRLTALEAQAEARLALGDHALLADELGPLADAHPLRERLQAVHLRALYLSGRQSEALAGFDRIRERLADELGADPGPELAEVHLAILKQDPALVSAVATSTARARPNLPAPVTSIVGRERDVAEATALLADSRLVTLTGPGGVGKTRVALAVAAQAEAAWMVELASLRSGGLAEVTELTAETIGVRDETAGAPIGLTDRLADALRSRETLLVLDNCEHLIETAAELAAQLLRAVPGLRILATSQEPLAIPGERVHQLGPLNQNDAAELFAARAGIAIDESNRDEVASICARLDGLPLALELAAARVRALGVHGVAERLDDRFKLLSAQARGVPERQRTLRGMIDWSWDQLDPEQQEALCRLAVHPGGCTADAADADPDLLGRLVNRSMAVAETQPTGEMRYRLLESVAAYCLERLGDDAAVLDRRDAYYAALAEQADLCGPLQRQWLQRLDQERPNLMAVLDRHADPALTVRLAWYCYLRGKYSEAYRRCGAVCHDPDTAALAHGFALLMGRRPDDAYVSQAASPRSRWFVALAHLHLGDVAVARELLDRAIAEFQDSGDRWGEAAALASHAKLALHEGDLELAERSGTRSLGMFTVLGDGWGVLQAADQLAYLAEIGGDYERAARLHRDGLRRAEDLQLWVDVSYRLSSLGRIAMLTGDFERAKEFHERGERLAAEQSNPFAAEFARVGLALIARRTGDLDEAEARLERSLAWQRALEAESGLISYGVTLQLAELGSVAEMRGDAARARAYHQEALLASQAIGDPRAIALAHEGLAGVAALEGSFGEAEALLAKAATIREAAGAPLPEAERHDLNRIRARIAAGRVSG